MPAFSIFDVVRWIGLMRYSMRLCLLLFTFVGGVTAWPQQSFDLDTTFRTEIDTYYVNSIYPLPDGKIFVSGQIRVPTDPIGVLRGSVKLLPDGSRDPDFPSFPQTTGGGRIVPWMEDHMYVQSSHTVRRLTIDGLVDPSFISMNLGSYFVSLQGGDYHVYPDGRILMSGVHNLHDSIRGFEGLHCLIWFSDQGYLDTTKTHRTCAGSLNTLQELPDGKFIGSLGNPPNSAAWDGQPTGSNIIRFHADGKLDTTFQANVWWGEAYGFLPMQDGRIHAVGRFQVEGIQDTLLIVRFLQDGSLDPGFNNHLDLRITEMTGFAQGAIARSIQPLGDDRLVVTGQFELVEGLPIRNICLIDTSGYVADEYFTGPGCGNFTYQGLTRSTISGIMPGIDGNWYIWGAYHGYDDGTTNDTLQRMISRLYGFDVSIGEHHSTATINVFPNPGDEQITIDLDVPNSGSISVQVYSSLGEAVLDRRVRQLPVTLNTKEFPSGLYTILMETSDRSKYQTKWIKE